MHVMIDLETMSSRANAAILEIGAVMFDPLTGLAPLKEPFSRHVDLQSAIAAGSHVEADTLMWWLGQDQTARDALKPGQGQAVPLSQALADLAAWLPREEFFVWSHGATFDVVILEVAWSRFGQKAPWKFWNIRDTRTLFAIAGKKLADLVVQKGTKHNALDDATNQALAVCKAHHMLGIKR